MVHSATDMKRAIRDNSATTILFFNQSIRCDPSLELPRLDGSNYRFQSRFLWKINYKYPIIILVAFLSGALIHV